MRNRLSESEWVSLVKDATIASHKAAWEYIESLRLEAKVKGYYLALLNTDYPMRVEHIRAYATDATGVMRSVAEKVLIECGYRGAEE